MPKMNPTVQAGWEEYVKVVLVPAGVIEDSAQWTEMRRSFFAGASHLMLIFKEIDDHKGISENAGVAIMESLDQELIAYYARMRAGTE